MKYLIYFFIAVFNLSFITASFAQQSQKTSYIHGYNSGPSIWPELYNYLNQHYRLESNPKYVDLTTSNSISNYALQCSSQLGSNQYMAISHSMGGLVARDLIRQKGQGQINKLITIGTPHRGAMIVNAIESGYLSYVVTCLTSDLTDGPAYSLWGSGYVNYIKDLLLMTGGQFLQGYLISTVNDPAAQDMKYGSSFINTINSSSVLTNETYSRAGIWGDENSVRPVRLAASRYHSGASDGYQNNWVSYYNGVRNVYSAVACVYYWYAWDYIDAYYDTGNLWYYYAALQLFYTGDMWLNGYVALKYRFPDSWDWATGAIMNNGTGYKWGQSDAFINAYSQNFPKNNTTNWKGNHRAENAGHMQQTYHQKVKDKLILLFGPTYFNIPHR